MLLYQKNKVMGNNELSTRTTGDVDTRRAELGIEKAKLAAQTTGLKLLMWLIIITVCGIIACGVLAVLKIAAQALVAVGAILLAICLVAVIAYNAVRYKIKERRVDKDDE